MNLDIANNKKEHRLQYRFWLDVVREDEYHLAEYVETLKRQRSFAATIRDALALIQDLRQGSVRLLLLLFPWIWDKIAAEIRAAAVTTPNSQLIPELEAQITRMERLLAQPAASPKPLAASLEPELEIKTARLDEDEKPSWNNHISMAKLLGNFDHLSAEMIDYGVRKGLIPSLKPKSAGSAKMMVVPPLEAPSYDEQDLEQLALE